MFELFSIIITMLMSYLVVSKLIEVNEPWLALWSLLVFFSYVLRQIIKLYDNTLL